jgi:hypothetical protein
MEAKYSFERYVDRRNNMVSVRQKLNFSMSFGLTLASEGCSNNMAFVYSVNIEFKKKKGIQSRIIQ